ncbi:MAG: hypothetical protein AAF433_14045 [Bacteroidota bacterium]
MKLDYQAGQTPINEDEKHGLKIKSLVTMKELDQFEQQNIENALLWVLGKSFTSDQVLKVDFILTIHRRMFSDVWK